MTNQNVTTTNKNDLQSRKRHNPSQKGKSVTTFDDGADYVSATTKEEETTPGDGRRAPVSKEFPTASQIADYFEQFNLQGLSAAHSMYYKEWKFLLFDQSLGIALWIRVEACSIKRLSGILVWSMLVMFCRLMALIVPFT
jgi:hypothetical protein